MVSLRLLLFASCWSLTPGSWLVGGIDFTLFLFANRGELGNVWFGHRQRAFAGPPRPYRALAEVASRTDPDGECDSRSERRRRRRPNTDRRVPVRRSPIPYPAQSSGDGRLKSTLRSRSAVWRR